MPLFLFFSPLFHPLLSCLLARFLPFRFSPSLFSRITSPQTRKIFRRIKRRAKMRHTCIRYFDSDISSISTYLNGMSLSLAINRYIKPPSRSRSFAQLSHDFRISAISERRRHCGLPVVVHAHRSEEWKLRRRAEGVRREDDEGGGMEGGGGDGGYPDSR